MTFSSKYWAEFLKTLLGLIIIIGIAGVWAGDQRWMTVAASEQLISNLEIRQLDRQITFLQIKIDQGEATSSDKIWIQTLRQQLRALKND